MWGFTLEQIRDATKTQIITWVTNKLEGMTKKQIIMRLLDIQSVSDKPIVTYYPDGQLESRLIIERDVLGAKLGSFQLDFLYYRSGEIDTITLVRKNADDVEAERQVIKHYLDGRQPITRLEM